MTDHDYQAAAEQLHVSAAWLKKNLRRRGLPHQKYGKLVRFTDEQIAEIRRQFEQRADVTPTPPGELRPTTTRRRAS